jgi:hypothetical protein
MQTESILPVSTSSQNQSLVYRKAESGYEKIGALPPGTRSVRIHIDERVGTSLYKPKRAIQIIDEAIAGGSARASCYEIFPVTVDDPAVVAQRTTNLNKAREARKKKRA